MRAGVSLLKHHEFWHPRVFELPYYVYLGWQCLWHRVGVRTLAKANYCLDHGEIGLGSKYVTQLAFDQGYFLPTMLLDGNADNEEKKQQMVAFAEQHGYPLILKSDVGCVGKGIRKVHSAEEIETVLPLLLGDYIVQQFTPYSYECGIFFVRDQRAENPRGDISGINRKHFPMVVGNGVDSLHVLARKHERFTHHWQSFLQYLDMERVPEKGEAVCLSFIGSHTLGCRFTDDSDVLTPALEEAVREFFARQPGYNFGRVDVKAESEAALQRGEFVVIEVNGVASLPTHMFDPKYSLQEAYRIFLSHARSLVAIAKQHQQQPMTLLSYREIMRRVKCNQSMLNQVHHQLKKSD
jgi:hypothetical protein